MCLACTCVWVLFFYQIPSATKQRKSDIYLKSQNPDSTRSQLTEFERKKKIKRAQQNKRQKCLCQCTDWLSATQNGQGLAECFSTLLESRLLSSPCSPTHCDWNICACYFTVPSEIHWWSLFSVKFTEVALTLSCQFSMKHRLRRWTGLWLKLCTDMLVVWDKSNLRGCDCWPVCQGLVQLGTAWQSLSCTVTKDWSCNGACLSLAWGWVSHYT